MSEAEKNSQRQQALERREWVRTWYTSFVSEENVYVTKPWNTVQPAFFMLFKCKFPSGSKPEKPDKEY